jgi:hypothetical protein
VVSLDDIRVRGRWSLRLARTALAALLSVWSRRRRRRALCRLYILTANGAVAWLSVSAGLLVCDDVVGGAAVGALAVGNLLVLLVGLGVLEDDVPGVQEAGEEAETAERNVYERVGAADALLHPDCAES